MGQTRVLLRVYGPLGSAEVETLVDTGATFTKIPRSTATRIGLEQSYETSVELGDGSVTTRGLALAEVEVESIRRPMLVALGNDREAPLLGYTTLELLGFKVNPVTQKLEKTTAIEYQETLLPQLAPPGSAADATGDFGTSAEYQESPRRLEV